MKRALVLAGGGSKGAYEVGFVKALHELGIDYQIVTGTSIGALNGCLLAQQDYHAMEKLWQTMEIGTVFAGNFDKDFTIDLDSLLNQSNLYISFFKSFIKEKGADITPLKTLIRNLLKEDQLLTSPIDFGLCTVRYPSLKPLFITKEEMNKEHIFDYLISSASCFPVFPIYSFDNQSFIDGGYYDNVPVDMAFDMGAQDVIVVDMRMEATHPHYLNRPHVIYTTPYIDLGMFMDFSRETLDRNQRIGYQTAMKTFGNFGGVKYTFKHFETPLFHEFYTEVLYLERYIRSLTRSDAAGNLFEKYKESHKNQPLEEKDYLYVTLDWLMEIMERDASYVYDFHLFVKDLLSFFDKYMQPDFQMVSFRSFDEFIESFKELSKKGMIGRLLHEMLYPSFEKIDFEKISTLFSREMIMAKLLFLLYHTKEK